MNNYLPQNAQAGGSRAASIHSDMSNNHSQHNDGERPRKRVRKGTKSCWECKRRKVKCQLSSEDVPVCSGCLARGTSCLSQEFPEERDSSGGLQVGERLGRVERLLETLVAKISAYEEEENAQKILTPESISNEIVLSESAVEVHPANNSSPFLGLFDNNMIGHPTPAGTPRTGTRTPSTRTACSRPTKADRLRQSLVPLLPSQEDIDTICRASHCSILLNSLSWSTVLINETSRGAHFSPFNIADISKDKPGIIARTLLYVAVCWQQIDPSFDSSKLQVQPSIQTRVERILSTVNALITSDDELVTTVEGIECLVLQGMYAINAGSPRRAWLIFRRCINIAQMLGLDKKTPPPEFPKAKDMWHQVVQGDRYLSLLLGLAAATNEDHFGPDENFQNPNINKDELFGRKLSTISLRIIQRNQAGTNPAYGGTQEIDDMLDTLYRDMPSTWWEVPTYISDDLSPESSENFHRLMNQIWYFQIQGLVHLPFMLRAATERRYEYSKFSCLRACREVMWRYLAMRKSYNKSFCCRVIDFGALTATVALYLGQLDPNQGVLHGEMPNQRENDRALIDMVLKAMEEFAVHSNEVVASQSASVIRALLAAEKQMPGANGNNLRLTIPYFGTITIVRPQAPVTPPVTNQNGNMAPLYPAQRQGSITIGGPDSSAQPWQGLQTPNSNPLNFPTVSFQSSYFNQVPETATPFTNMGWEEADTVFFDSLLNADIEGNWMI